MKRVFLIGAPKSGTTFLYSLLASHPSVLSMPETGMFEAIAPWRFKRISNNGILSMQAVPRAANRPTLLGNKNIRLKLSNLSRQLGLNTFVPIRFNRETYAVDFRDMLDNAALLKGCSVWIEKTPNHVFSLDVIERLIPGALYIHLIRYGQDVVASFVNASIKYADHVNSWTFSQSIPWIVSYWNGAVLLQLSRLGKANHIFILYEDLLDNLESTLEKLFSYIGCAYETRNNQIDIGHIANLEHEPWKSSALLRQVVPSCHYSAVLFGKGMNEWLTANLISYDLVRKLVNRKE